MNSSVEAHSVPFGNATVPARDRADLLTRSPRIPLGLVAWFAMFCSILMWQQADLRPGELGDTTNYYRIILVLFAAAASVWTLLRNAGGWPHAFPGPWVLLLLYAVVAITSSLYIPAHAFYSMWKSFEVLVDLLAIAAILSYSAPQNVARRAYQMFPVVYAVMIVTYLVEAIAMPSEALHPSRGYIPIQLLGVLPAMPENGLAYLSAVCAFAIFCRLGRPGAVMVKAFYGLFMILALVTLILAQSRTSLVGFLAAVLVYLIVDRRFVLSSVLVAAIVLAVSYTQFSDISTQYLIRGQDEELVTSLSGRTEGWQLAWLAFQEAPIAGYGFAAFARANILGPEGPSTMHGAVFDVIVGTGLLGLLPWAGAILWTLIRLLKLSFNRHPWFQSPVGRNIQAEMLGLAMIIMIRSTTSSGLALHEDNFMLFLTLLAYASTMQRAASAMPPTLLAGVKA